MANFWKYTGSEERRYPAWGLTADPGYVYDFGAGSQPNDGRWVSDPGPATAPPPPVLPGVVATGPQPGQVPVWDAASASYLPTDLSTSFAPLGIKPRRRVARPESTIVSRMQAGHGWTAGGSGVGSSNVNDTSDFVLGTQSAWLSTNGNNGFATFQKSSGLTLDATGKMFRLLVKVDDTSVLNTATFYAGDNTFTNTFQAYFASGAPNRDTQNEIRSGEWTWLTIPWSAFTVNGTPTRSNITGLRIVPGDKNTGTGVKLHIQAIELVPEPTAYPNGVCTFALDDGSISHWNAAKPKLDAYGYRATAFPKYGELGKTNQMTVAQLQTAQQASGWEIAAHASTEAVHASGIASMTAAQVTAEMVALRTFMRDNGFHSNTYAPPSGDISATAEPIVAQHFDCSRALYWRLRGSLPVDNPMRIRAVNAAGLSLAAMQAEVDAAYANKGWVVFTFHALVTTKSDTNDVLISDFNSIVDYVNTKGIPVRTIGEVMSSLSL